MVKLPATMRPREIYIPKFDKNTTEAIADTKRSTEIVSKIYDSLRML
jgi:hypothetical protein